ncbi:potassium transporter [Flagelloscypha sp. PMI_526]|nr:potassium transporter [Flagelloscypha sp. PMI_526]
MLSTSLQTFLEKHLNFFRIHLLAFTFIPLIASGIFFASNGQYPVSYVDSLFLCYSSMTVTGLSTVNLSTITAWQQVILYLLMMMYNVVTMVSWIMVLVRKEYFKRKCEYVVNSRRSLRGMLPFRSRKAIITAGISSPKSPRLQNIPVDANPHVNVIAPSPAATLLLNKPRVVAEEAGGSAHEPVLEDLKGFSSSPEANSLSLKMHSDPLPLHSPHAIDFAHTTSFTPSRRENFRRRRSMSTGAIPQPHRRITMLAKPKRRNALKAGDEPERRYQGLGGFPGPLEIVKQVYNYAAPAKLQLKLKQTLTMEHDEKTPWLSFQHLLIGRNSDFHTDPLDDRELAEIGGTEYRALRLLSYLVPIYFVVFQLFSYLLFAPWLSTSTKYDAVFAAQPRDVKKPWFSLFQVMGAYTGGGLSLVDMGMVPFQSAYLMVVALSIAILAGNHALVSRFLFRWVLSKFANLFPSKRETWGATFTFLLKHPRRCFIYLFPAHQTWFLVICLVVFSIIEWAAFPVLNHGLPILETLTPGLIALEGFFQGICVRASGFAIVPIASLAPSIQFLYVVFMYIAIYPVAISIRSTNVYEERSLGVFEEPESEDEEEPDEDDLKGLTGRQKVNRYLGWHIRRQVSLDIWWLVWGVFLVAVIERHNLMDEEKKWFDLFRVLFELVSAFAGIGLTMGVPDNNYSFVGGMRTLSKLVVIVIMVRGRHRGLPVAVDRSVLLPSELVVQSSATPGTAQNGQKQESNDIVEGEKMDTLAVPSSMV